MNIKQQVLFIHGGEPDTGEKAYLDRLKNGRFELNLDDPKKWNKNQRKFLDLAVFEVITPTMPLGWRARYSDWKIWFERHIPFLRPGIILVGHSLGGNFLAKYLAEEDFSIHIGQLHLVAPSHSAFEDNFKISPGTLPGKLLEKKIPEIHIYHSKDDVVVSFSESEKYHNQIPDSYFHAFEDRGHFLDETFPELFDHIQKGLTLT